MKSFLLFGTVLLAFTLNRGCRSAEGYRTEISLNGSWEIVKSLDMDEIPSEFPSTVPVPGLVDLAVPALDTGKQYQEGVYWYRRGFTIEQEVPDRVVLRIGKVKYRARIYLNDRYVGEQLYCFTPAEFDVREYLNPPGTGNVLTIAVGTAPQMPDTVTWGHDFEKLTYIPGIYDNVKLILSGYPAIRNIQTVPLIGEGRVRIVADLDTGGQPAKAPLTYEIRELTSGKTVARGKSPDTDFTVPLPNAQLWTPDTPFLYELILATEADKSSVRFGMRSFTFDPVTRRAVLNGEPYYMRGTNVCIFRFFEDPDRAELPWDDQWAVDLHQQFKDMHWNSIRYCIGFPPERWYEIADSLGFLIQDEYPLWTLFDTEDIYPEVTAGHLASEFRPWLRAHWNHPSVVIWDAQNESVAIPTGEAVSMVREMDLSGRPWENGWMAPLQATDPMEAHPYQFIQYFRNERGRDGEGALKQLLSDFPGPRNSANDRDPPEDGDWYDNALIINEYAWLWLNRDGTPTTLTDGVYEVALDYADTRPERLEAYARHLGILTEYWRTQRLSAGVLHFCGLAYSRPEEPRGQTSDHFIDIQQLDLEPNFVEYVKPAFAPVGLMIRFWDRSVETGKVFGVDVVCINDLGSAYEGKLELSWVQGDRSVPAGSRDLDIPPYGRIVETYTVYSPAEPGAYELVAEIDYRGESVRSIREINVAE